MSIMVIPSVSGNRDFTANGVEYVNKPVNLSQMRTFERGVDPISGLWCIYFRPSTGLGDAKWYMPSLAQLEVEYTALLSV